MNPCLLKDFYKSGHLKMYPEGTSLVYSNLTARKARDQNIKYIVFFGLQYFVKEYLIKQFNDEFFNLTREEAVNSYKRIMDYTLGPGVVDTAHIGKLHDLGYLPIKIKALPEGTKCPIGVPCLTIVNTRPEFYWLTNMLETILSCIIWGMCTSATTSHEYRKIFDRYADETVGNRNHVQWQAHDFSMRGLFGLEAACMSGAAHLLSFTGSDSIPAGLFLEKYYGANIEKELVLASVPASEHSVSSLGSMVDGTSIRDAEFEVFRRLLQDVYPNGILSLVSDTYDFWGVITDFLPKLKSIIMNRDGKCVIRPDSSPKTPVEIMCGDPESTIEHEKKGLIECLWDTFGGTINSLGYKELDPHIGAIYGEAITLERAETICRKLKDKGFASNNFLVGVGSMSFQLCTRDTLGFAVKATYGEVNGGPREIFKDPKTDTGLKRSLKGMLMVYKENNIIKVKDRCSPDEEHNGLLRIVFEDGRLKNETSLSEIREILKSNV